MRKVLVVLLALSVLGGAFAQGNWSLGAGAEIGFKAAFNEADDDVVYSWGSEGYGYWAPWENWDLSKGTFGAQYWQGSLGLGLAFDTTEPFRLWTYYGGENYEFAIAALLVDIIDWAGFDELWGNMKFVDGAVKIEASISSAERVFWQSSTVADGEFMGGTDIHGRGFLDYRWGNDDPRKNYLATEFNFAGISFGALLRDFFAGSNPWHWDNGGVGGGWSVPEFDDGRGKNFIDDVLGGIVLGLKFNMDAVEFAAQFRASDYGAYLGATMPIGPVGFEFGFKGIFGADDEITKANVGFGVNFNPGLFNIGVSVVYCHVDEQPAGIAINPSFGFNILPDYMRFTLNARFAFNEDLFHWSFRPEILWNFKGTGGWWGSANSDWWSFNTGLGIMYVLERDTFNRLAVVFKWGM